MVSVLFKTFVFAGMIAWTRLGRHYRDFVLLAFLFPSAQDRKLPHFARKNKQFRGQAVQNPV
jgi:hypothetical protein